MSLPHGLLPMSGMTDATELSKGLSRLQALDMKLPGAYRLRCRQRVGLQLDTTTG